MFSTPIGGVRLPPNMFLSVTVDAEGSFSPADIGNIVDFEADAGREAPTFSKTTKLPSFACSIRNL
jgi:hypothetical protein